MKEYYFQDLVNNDKTIQRSILSALNINSNNYEFIREDRYPNGMIADFTVKSDNKIRAILELKGSDIGLNDFVRGIGQIMQYQHFADSGLSTKSCTYDDNAVAVYLLPSSIFKNNSFNIGLFKYPDKSVMLELNELNNSIRVISKKERENLALNSENKISISQYYIRDTRLYEIYLCLKFCQFNQVLGEEKIDRKSAELNFLRQLETINNRNWRNVFISLSSLGLIDSNNLPTNVGNKYASMSFAQFSYEMYVSYIKPYIDELMDVLLHYEQSDNKYFNLSCTDIKDHLNNKYNGKSIMYLTDSKNRYISSWLNIMRDDFKCIEFNPNSSSRRVIYKINDLNKSAIISKISDNNEANFFVRRLQQLFKK